MSLSAAETAASPTPPADPTSSARYFHAPVFDAPAENPRAWRLARLLRTDLIGSFPRAAYEQESLVQHLFGMKRILLNKPEAIRHVLVDNHENYIRPPSSMRLLRPMVGDGLLISEGESWRFQRRTIAPALTPRVVRGLAPVIVRVAQGWADDLARGVGQPADLLRQMRLLSLEIAARAMFSIDPGEDGRELRRLLEYFSTNIGNPRLLDFLIPPGFPSPYDFKRNRFRATVARVIERIIERRLKRPPGSYPQDLLEMLMAARDPETGEGFSRTQLRDEVTTMLVAGHETTGLALFWSLYLLASAPREQDRLAAEAASVTFTEDTVEEALDGLPFARAVASEAMRLYPPAALLNRWALAPDETDGIQIPRGSIVTISPWVLHHHVKLWEDPYRFDPDRFMPEATPPSRFAYLPFGIGPRICIGAQLALSELALVLGILMRRFRVECDDPHVPRPVSVVITRPDRPISFRLSPRG